MRELEERAEHDELVAHRRIRNEQRITQARIRKEDTRELLEVTNTNAALQAQTYARQRSNKECAKLRAAQWEAKWDVITQSLSRLLFS